MSVGSRGKNIPLLICGSLDLSVVFVYLHVVDNGASMCESIENYVKETGGTLK
jgi:hypothetical protein